MFGGLYILDHQRRQVHDATVVLNGEELVFDPQLEQYRIPEETRFPVSLEVQRFGFEPLVYPAFRYLTDRVFLLRKGDACYWNKGIRVACLPYAGQWLVGMKDPDPEQAARRLAALGQDGPMQILYAFPVEHPKGGGRIRNATFLARPADKDDPGMALARLRASPGVSFAGPALSQDADYLEVIGLAPYLHFFFKPEVDLEHAGRIVSENDMVAEPNPGFQRDGFLRVVLPPVTGMEAVDRVASLQPLPEIRYIDNEIVNLNSF